MVQPITYWHLNMRTSNISYTVSEDFRSIEEYPGEFVRVSVGAIGSNGEWAVPQQYMTDVISNENYSELLSASPAWAPEKPAGVYRNDDLWVFIDRERNKE